MIPMTLRSTLSPLAWLISLVFSLPAAAAVFVQCPGDTDGDAIIDTPDPKHPRAVCKHLSGGDGFIQMADGRLQYMFGFSDVTGVLPEGPLGNGAGGVMETGMLAANFPAPTIAVKEGDEFYLTLTNVGMVNRPDLFDPHSVHFHGFPNAAPIFDGVPESTIAINMGSSVTYYYNIVEPGTFIPLPRGSHRAHADGHAGQPVRASGAERDAENLPGRNLHHLRLQRWRRLHRLRRGVPDPDRFVRSGVHDASMNVRRCPSPTCGIPIPCSMAGYPDTVNTLLPARLPG
jgi:hypothetical protein